MAPSLRHQRGRSLHCEGLRALLAGEPQAAAGLLALAVKEDAGDAVCHSNLGIALRQCWRLREAASSFEAAVALSPIYAQAHYNLGVTLGELGRAAEARIALQHATQYQPDHAEAHYALAELLCGLGEVARAGVHLHKCLAIDPADALGVRLFLARLGCGDLPQAAPEAQIRRLYRRRASTWDASQGYFAHRLVAQSLAAATDARNLTILDLGCGTGLTGELVRSVATELHGVDLSPEMLAIARQKEVFAELHEADLVAFMLRRPARYDVVVAAGTLIHFGDLRPVLAAAAVTLRPGGLIVFTVYSNCGLDEQAAEPHPIIELAAAGCFAHGLSSVVNAAGFVGLDVLDIRRGTHESNGVVAVEALAATLKLPFESEGGTSAHFASRS